ncbi:MAG TPA: tryptophan--tRNA ligase [Candidatus Saccharimonadales bacterium]|nr:tryptophan--tRNA ligase [Candidatus Saccharimonadales bacterium]
MSKPVILTGLRANNDLHIGNYFGALLPLIDLAKKHAGDYQINLFVPDLHSFTTPIDHKQLYGQTMNNVKLFAAAGLSLDNHDVYVYRQSFVSAHSELTIILNSFTGFGEMSRMTQFKDKAYKNVIKKKIAGEVVGSRSMTDEEKQMILERVSVGLFDYPVLMASDILLYGASYVPVGDDQSQHLEFTRDIAERMNKKFGDLFVVPKPVSEQHKFFGKDQGLRIRDLLDPTKKMSKSDDTGKGVIFLSDSPDEAKQKILSAATDSLGKISYDFEKQPGVSNLLDILKLLGGKPDEFIGNTQYGPLKEAASKALGDFLREFQSKLSSVDEKALLSKIEASENEMNKQANETLLKVQKAVGLRA